MSPYWTRGGISAYCSRCKIPASTSPSNRFESVELPQQPLRVKSNPAPRHDGYEESEECLTIRFEGTDETLPVVAQSVTNELDCCSFAEFDLCVSLPYDATKLIISGPEKTQRTFHDEFVARLEERSEVVV